MQKFLINEAGDGRRRDDDEDAPSHNREYMKQRKMEKNPHGRPCSKKSGTYSLKERDSHPSVLKQ